MPTGSEDLLGDGEVIVSLLVPTESNGAYRLERETRCWGKHEEATEPIEDTQAGLGTILKRARGAGWDEACLGQRRSRRPWVGTRR